MLFKGLEACKQERFLAEIRHVLGCIAASQILPRIVIQATTMLLLIPAQ